MTISVDLNMVNAFIPGRVQLGDDENELIARRDQLLGPAHRLMYERPLHLVRGEGVWLYDTEGTPYLDVYNNVTSLGHCHPDVVEAVTAQIATLSTNTRYLHETILELADRLLATTDCGLSHMMLTCTGSEANDLAYRIAKTRTGGTGVIVTETAYHGITDSVSQFSPSLGVSVDLGAHVRTVPAPSLYHAAGIDLGEAFAHNVASAITDLKRHGIRPAALIVDTLFTSDGILSDPPGFLKGAVDVIHAAGGLFIADEVQPGFGRTGKSMWGFQRHSVAPDIVTLGKPMGNGYPIAGLLTRHDVVESFGRNARYFNTFGGNTAACAAALAVLTVIQRDGLIEKADIVGSYLKAGLDQMASRHTCMGDVRGAGLFLAVEIVSDRQTKAADRDRATKIVNAMREKHILISACAAGHNVLKIRPPITFTHANADMFIATLEEALNETA